MLYFRPFSCDLITFLTIFASSTRNARRMLRKRKLMSPGRWRKTESAPPGPVPAALQRFPNVQHTTRERKIGNE